MCSIIGVGERLHKVLGQIGSKLWFPWQQKPPLTYNGENDVSTFSRLFLIRSFLARLYKSKGRAIAVTTASTSALPELFKMLKFLVKVFKSLFLLNPRMDLVDTLPNVTYLSEVLCYTVTTHISDLEIKGMDFEILS